MGKIYVMSDIHGCFNTFEAMLKKIKFSIDDHLYIMGDIIDRGKFSMDMIKFCMNSKNITLIRGNHEQMMLDAVDLIRNYDNNYELTQDEVLTAKDWFHNGGIITYDGFKLETKESQEEILSYLEDLKDYKLVAVNNRKFLLVHAGLYIPEGKNIPEDISLDTILSANIKNSMHLYVREGFLEAKEHIRDTTIVFGHTPVSYIPQYNNNINKTALKRCKERRIYKTKYKVGIDCGTPSRTGVLACLCLTDMKEYYEKIKLEDVI